MCQSGTLLAMRLGVEWATDLRRPHGQRRQGGQEMLRLCTHRVPSLVAGRLLSGELNGFRLEYGARRTDRSKQDAVRGGV